MSVIRLYNPVLSKITRPQVKNAPRVLFFRCGPSGRKFAAKRQPGFSPKSPKIPHFCVLRADSHRKIAHSEEQNA